MRYQRLELCHPGDILYSDVRTVDTKLIVEKGIILDNFYIRLLYSSGIRHVTICTTEKEANNVSKFSLFYKQEDEVMKSFAHHFISEMLETDTVQELFTGMQKDLKRHQINVAMLTTMFLRRNGDNMMGEGKLIAQGALLHDIGKNTIPDEILYAKRKLTKDEKRYVELHTQAGYSTLSVLGYKPTICNIALMHHENDNGSGYPNGFSKDEITYGAKIVHIADAYEAICAKRSYKSPMEREIAKSIMLKDQYMFDTDLLKLFLEIIPTYFIGDLVEYKTRFLKVIGYDNDKTPLFRDLVSQEEFLLTDLDVESINPVEIKFDKYKGARS